VEYRILKEVLGQALICNALLGDLPIVAVPDSRKYARQIKSAQQRTK
jgi:hypothetical protein